MALVAYKKPTLPEHTYRQTVSKYHTLDVNGIKTACPLDYGMHCTKRHTSHLGVLEGLPDELLLMVLLALDYHTLTVFRRLNKRARQMVNSIIQFKIVMNTCRALPRSLLSTGRGSQFSIQDLVSTLTGYKCATCGDFAGYANILTCTRVCHLCFFEEREYYPLTASEAARRFGVSRGSFASLPSLKSIPRTYARRQTPCKTRLTLYDPESARRMSIEHHGSSQAMEAHVAEHTQKALEAYQQRLALHSQSGYQGPRPRAPPRAGLEDGSTHEARPYMAIVRIPWVSRLTRTVTAVEWGFHCRACSKQNNRPLGQHWLRKFCAETFEEHLAECGPIDWAEGRGYFHRTEGMLGGVLSS
jgi:hypothetical protein